MSVVPSVEYAKTRISPSDLTFGWSNCKRCFWMKHVYGVSHQGPFPGIVMSLSSRQERWYKEKHSRDFSSSLPTGMVHSTGKMLESKPIIVDGLNSLRTTIFCRTQKLVNLELARHSVYWSGRSLMHRNIAPTFITLGSTPNMSQWK